MVKSAGARPGGALAAGGGGGQGPGRTAGAGALRRAATGPRDGATDAPLPTKARGDAAEDRALAHLLRQGLQLVARNYRVAGGPRQRGAEIDLVMRTPGGTLVFVEVRARAAGSRGGAAASIGHTKQRRIVRAAQHFLLRLPVLPPCRFDVVAIDGDTLQWLPGAFDTGA